VDLLLAEVVVFFLVEVVVVFFLVEVVVVLCLVVVVVLCLVVVVVLLLVVVVGLLLVVVVVLPFEVDEGNELPVGATSTWTDLGGFFLAPTSVIITVSVYP